MNVYEITGTWYEIARIDEFYETKLCNTTVSFTIDEDKSLRIVIAGNFENFDGDRITYEGKGHIKAENSPRMDI